MSSAQRRSDQHPTPPVFHTLRLRLRVIGPRDEDFLARLDSNPAVMQYIHSGPLSSRAAARYARVQVELAPHRWHLHKWIVELRDESPRASVGWIELSKFRGRFDPDEDDLSDDVNLGYQFDPAYWGRGFAAESAGPVLRYAFERLELRRLVAYTQRDNARSVRVLEKLGFQQHSRTNYKDDGGNECRLFVLTASQWEEGV